MVEDKRGGNRRSVLDRRRAERRKTNLGVQNNQRRGSRRGELRRNPDNDRRSNAGEVTQAYKETVKWCRKLAEQGDATAQNNLGMMYKTGKGVTQDFIQAHKWYTIAGGSYDGELGRKNRDAIEKRMTPDQIAEAQKLAREWMEKHEKK